MAKKEAGAAGNAPYSNYIFEYYDKIVRIKNGEKIDGVRAAGKYTIAIYKILTDGLKNGDYEYSDKKRKCKRE